MSKQGSERKAEQPAGEITDEMIAKRAYEISQSDEAGMSEENWERAERELREGTAPAAGETPAAE
jgi:hypothetical protein